MKTNKTLINSNALKGYKNLSFRSVKPALTGLVMANKNNTNVLNIKHLAGLAYNGAKNPRQLPLYCFTNSNAVKKTCFSAINLVRKERYSIRFMPSFTKAQLPTEAELTFIEEARRGLAIKSPEVVSRAINSFHGNIDVTGLLDEAQATQIADRSDRFGEAVTQKAARFGEMVAAMPAVDASIIKDKVDDKLETELTSAMSIVQKVAAKNIARAHRESDGA